MTLVSKMLILPKCTCVRCGIFGSTTAEERPGMVPLPTSANRVPEKSPQHSMAPDSESPEPESQDVWEDALDAMSKISESFVVYPGEV